MKAIDRPFTKIINGTTQFVIPVFQPDYSSTETQFEQHWKYLLRLAINHLGFVCFGCSVGAGQKRTPTLLMKSIETLQ